MSNDYSLGIDSTVSKLKKGDHIFTVDFGKDIDDEKPSFKVKEYEIKSVLHNQVDGGDLYYKIFDIKHPSVEVKTNLKSGFFSSPEEAAKEFISSIEYLLEESRRAYSEQFSN